MSKELEALESINEIVLPYSVAKQGHLRPRDVCHNEFSIIEKSLKALEIIKQKEVDIHNLLISKTVEQYNGYTHWLGCKGNLTEEEYDLLKEVLL